MPTYQYACNDCGEQLEVVQKFTDDALTVCPACQGNLRKVFSAVGIVFKGSGFYRTDSRSSSSSSPASSSSSSTSSSSSSKSESSAGKSESSSSSSSSSTPAASAATN
ncbi:FmdB family transcriptional regulator [Nonomuraea sp. SMC257]|uniref:FmdB family transcriptional regulator n=1 Tax=Nonomuraea montanisoli TaxID=2741721 RepID=A0A7Y6IC82_9ACTN|nr:FmdB family zinc ribbon protein [Nonomuraea montanisoli]NUW35557.1 FmdB family transcriptional regulator [Nonomuraea montanisoli]